MTRDDAGELMQDAGPGGRGDEDGEPFHGA